MRRERRLKESGTIYSKKKIAIIGAGLAGLACARDLQKKGFRPVVFEKESEVGGRTKSFHLEEIALDLGAQIYTSAAKHLKRTIDEMRAPAYYPHRQKCIGLLTEGKISCLSLRFLFLSLLTNKTLSGHRIKTVWGAVKLLRAIRRLPRRPFGDLTEVDPRLSGLTTRDYLTQFLPEEAIDQYIDPIYRGFCFQSVHETSASLFVNLLIPVLSSCLNRKKFASFRFKEGFQSLAKELAQTVDCRLNHPISEVAAEGKQIRVVGEREEWFDAVVFAAPAFAVRKIYRNPSPCQEEFLDRAFYSSTATLYFSAPPELDTWKGPIFVNENQNRKIAYISTSSRTDRHPHLIKKRPGIFFVCIQDGYAKEMARESEETLFLAVREELGRLLKLPKERLREIEPLYLHRWENAFPKYTPSFVEDANRFLSDPEGQGRGCVFFCGDYLNAPFTEGAISSGQRAAALLLNAL